MKTLSKILALAALGAITLPGMAQVYESKDAEGHPVFSDKPSEGAKEVKVKPANAADSVEVRQSPPENPGRPAAASTAPERGSEEYQQKLDREMEAYRRQQEQLERERQGIKRDEVGDDADMHRHEVGDDSDMRRREVGTDEDSGL